MTVFHTLQNSYFSFSINCLHRFRGHLDMVVPRTARDCEFLRFQVEQVTGDIFATLRELFDIAFECPHVPWAVLFQASRDCFPKIVRAYLYAKFIKCCFQRSVEALVVHWMTGLPGVHT